MAQQVKKKDALPRPMSAMERLSLRVSSMINHPIAQERREVTIHRLDTDGDREWGEMLGLIAETDGIDMVLNADGAITLRWESSEPEDWQGEVSQVEAESAPF
jgi:hypothetical protein